MAKKDMSPQPSSPVTAEEIQRTVQAAKALESIPGQELLEDPALNPATRAKYDALTAERLEAALQATHRRKLAEAAEQARQAEEAAQVAAIIDQAKRATSPARTIIDMSRHQRTFGRVSLGASLLLSVGSAIGLGALVDSTGGPMPVGWVAEVGLTGLSTTVIIWRGLLARAGTVIDSRTGWLLLFLMVAPLLASTVGSYFGTGVVGVACSAGSALFAGLAYLINTTSAAAIGQSIAALNEKKEAPAPSERLSEQPAHTDTPRASTPAHTDAGDGLDVVGEAIAEGAADFLRSHGTPSERLSEHPRLHGDTEDHTETENGQVTPSDHPRSHGDDNRPLTAQERRRLEGLKNRERVADFLYEHPDATHAEVAEALDLGVSTVRRIRKDLESGGASNG